MKIEDLTLKEIKQQCDRNGNFLTACDPECPIRPLCFDGYFGKLPWHWTTEDMERDIEGVNK